MADLILIYCYYFDGVQKPLTVQATCRKEARMLLPEAIKGNKDYQDKSIQDIVSETVFEPVTGVTKIMIDSDSYVWGGQENGWQKESDDG